MNLLLSVLRIVVVRAVMWFPAAVPLFGLIFCLFSFRVQVVFEVCYSLNQFPCCLSREMIEACTKGGGNGLLNTTPDRCFNHNFVFLYYFHWFVMEKNTLQKLPPLPNRIEFRPENLICGPSWVVLSISEDIKIQNNFSLWKNIFKL